MIRVGGGGHVTRKFANNPITVRVLGSGNWTRGKIIEGAFFRTFNNNSRNEYCFPLVEQSRMMFFIISKYRDGILQLPTFLVRSLSQA